MTMPAVEALSSITPGIAPMLDALVAASGWNQTALDWRLFERLGTLHGVRDEAGQLIASGAVLPMEGVAWISMILVIPTARGQGLGRAVFARCLDQVKTAGLVAMLDATPQGEPLYASFGFTPLWRLTRWQREAAPATASLTTDKPALDSLAALDAQALGFARPAVLADLLGREDSRCVRNGLGFGLVRAGRTAHHIGPLLSSDEAVAAALLTQAARGIDGRIYIDVPDDRKAMTAALRAAGFTPQRSFARMALATREGAQPPIGHPAFIHAIAGPEFA
ncbi:GNAT superfamily N-acetyltransferase [Variovorax boronicumulans]|uniref:GNAT family N-acetyltransferase n=1 Tax=Variovorax boronicumulans TaxID=436515 RepID=UPI00278675E3|nr:GNAT family N-acetyltransferase [Variovorax boronicumulans]MDP9910310.1 GNAT superfamily N-acetyltransferase [Variovorax boronicumulans]